MEEKIIEELPITIEADIDDVRDPRRYEIGYLLVPIIGSEQITQAVETLIKATITSLGGQVIDGEEPKLIPLMYSIRKTIDNKNLRFKEGYFASLRFTLAPDQVATLDQTLLFSPSMLRFLIIESPVQIEEPRRRPPEENLPLAKEGSELSLPAEAMSQTDMDREIDSLLAVTT